MSRDDGVESLAHGGVIIDVERGQMDWKLFFRGYFADFRAAIKISHRRSDRVSGARERDGGREPNAAARSGDQSRSHARFRSPAAAKRRSSSSLPHEFVERSNFRMEPGTGSG